MGGLSHTALGLLLLSLARPRGAQADNSTAAEADACLAPAPWDAGPWGAALEDWATATAAHNQSLRQGRVMNLPPAPGYYITDRVDRPPPPPPPHRPPPPPHGPHGPQPYDEWSPPGGGKIVNRPGAGGPQKDKPFKPSPAYPAPPNQIPPSTNQNPHRGPGLAAPPRPGASPAAPPRPPPVDRIDEPPRKQVTETDLYLLTAIEKLVYRVDLMEKRLRKLEENVHYLVVGADPKPEPCVANFTRVAGTCYHFSGEALDWKSANLACRRLRASLLELGSEDERRKMVSAMLGDKRIRGMDVWTGGLNPGLLWIWSHSARPVLGNSTTAHGVASGAMGDGNGAVTIVGEGRCLALVHDPAVNNYVYRGQDCAFRHRYICEKDEDKTKLSNEIERVARGLKDTAHTARRTRLLLAGGGTGADQ